MELQFLSLVVKQFSESGNPPFEKVKQKKFLGTARAGIYALDLRVRRVLRVKKRETPHLEEAA